MKQILVPSAAEGTRIDVFLANYADGIATRSAAQKLIDGGKVQVGGKTVLKRHIVKALDEVSYELQELVPMAAIPENIPLDIVYEDDEIIIVNKPKGIVVHPAPGHFTGTLVNALLFHAKNSLSSIGGEFRPGIVHRLDKDTSGLMAIAKNNQTHTFLAEQLANREMGRMYLALCHGRIKQEEFTIDLPIGRHPKDRKKMGVVNRKDRCGRSEAGKESHIRNANVRIFCEAKSSDGLHKGKPATTHVKVLEYVSYKNKVATLIEARLQTGRTHQIRVHLAHINHPVLGDEVYGNAKCGGNGQILHAAKLSLIHPTTKKQMEFFAPLPEYFRNLLLFTPTQIS